MGLPQEGPGAVAGYGRRLVALVVDWLLAMLVVAILTARHPLEPAARSLATLAVFGAGPWLAWDLRHDRGKRLAGLRVAA